MGPPYGIEMIVDATITIGNIIAICTIASGGIAAITTIRNRVINLKSEISSIRENLQEEIKNMKDDFIDMKKEITKVGEVLIKMAVTDQRLLGVEQDLRDLKHGRGFVQHEIQGE